MERTPRLPIDLAAVETFLAVAETGGFSAAARRLCLTQPAVTARVAQLEAILGVRLFERTTRRVQPTAAGERLQAAAAPMLESLHAAVLEIRAEGDGARATVSIACTGGVAARVMPPLIRGFRTERPDLSVRLHDVDPVEALAAVQRREADFAVMAAGETAAPLRFTPLVRDCCVVIAPAGHPVLDSPGGATLADVLAGPVVMGSRQPALLAALQRLARTRGLVLRRAPESDDASSLLGLLGLVAAGCGLMFQPRSLKPELGPELGWTTLRDAELRHDYGLVTPVEGVQRRAARAFEAYAAAELKTARPVGAHL